MKIASELTNKTYRHAGYQKVVLHEKKRRDLAVASVPDRVVHRLLYDFLTDNYDKCFDPDVWSCRVGKGLHKCLARTQRLLRKYPRSYIWRADITKFFDNVRHYTLMDCLRRKIAHDKQAIWLCQEVILSYNLNGIRNTEYGIRNTERGIPIGNLTSQIFANIYLNEFDRFVRHSLKPQAYVRYGDDFILITPTRCQAYEARKQAVQFLQSELDLRLNPKNDVVVATKDGLKFLGHAISRKFTVVDKHTTRTVLTKINARNIASYKALFLVPEVRNQLDWILLEKYFYI